MNTHIELICNKVFKEFNSTVFKNKTIFITGANGLIGGMLSDYFHFLNEKYNYNIKLILSSRSEKESASRIADIINAPLTAYISKNLSLNINWDELSNIEIDYCFYCAGYAQPAKFISQPMETLNINTNSLYSTLNAVLKTNKKAKCIYLSSSEIYSSNTNSIYEESNLITFNHHNNRNFYILGKLNGESIVNNFRNLGYNVISARVSLCFGPGVLNDDSRVITDLVRKGLTSSEIKLFDSGKAIRKYIYLSDFCVMLFNVIENGKHEVYNIGGVEEMTIFDMATIIGNVLNKPVKLGLENNITTKSAPDKVTMSLNRYHEEFGDRAFMPVITCIEYFVDWYKNSIYLKN